MPNGYLCQCDDGYTGEICDGVIDNCDPDPCIYGTCTDLFDDFQCSCEPGYTGDICGEGDKSILFLVE